MITSPPKRGMALVVVLVLLAVMMLVTITLSGRMQQQLGRTRSQQEYQQALWYSASAESLALSALSLSLKNEKRVHLAQPWASGPRFFPLPQGQIAVTLRDAQACFNLNALAQPTTASRPLAVQQLIALISRLDVPAYRAELIAESLWEFIDEDRSVQTRLGREDSEYLARSVPFLRRQSTAGRYQRDARGAGNGRRALSKTETAGLCAADDPPANQHQYLRRHAKCDS